MAPSAPDPSVPFETPPSSGVRSRVALIGALSWGLAAVGSCIHPQVASTEIPPPIDGEASGVRPDTPVIEVPVTVHVAMRGERAMVSRKRVDEAFARANRELRPWGVELSLRDVVAMPDGLGRIESAEHRARLAEMAQRDGGLHVFFVGRVVIGDLRHRDRRVSGLHWRYRGPRHELRDRTFLVVARDAPVTTLVHEVGHVLGLEHEQHARDNIMCSCERTSNPTFTSSQGTTLRLGAERFTRTGVLVGLVPVENE